MSGGSREAVEAERVASDALARWYKAWNAHNVEAISALMTNDVRYEDPSAPSALMQSRAPESNMFVPRLSGSPT